MHAADAEDEDGKGQQGQQADGQEHPIVAGRLQDLAYDHVERGTAHAGEHPGQSQLEVVRDAYGRPTFGNLHIFGFRMLPTLFLSTSISCRWNLMICCCSWFIQPARITSKSYKTHRNCPAIYHIVAPDSQARLMIFTNKKGVGRMVSEDDGRHWRELPSLSLGRVGMPLTGVVRLKDGTTAAFGQVGVESGRQSKTEKAGQSVFMIVTADGGLTWGERKVIAAKEGKDLCEPFALRAPDGNELCCLMRENFHKGRSMMCFSRNEGKTWSAPADTPWGLTGDRHVGVQTPDGRWVIAFRDRALGSSTYGHFVAWVGAYDDLRTGRPGQFRIKLLHSYTKGDCGYPGLECLPDGTIVATTYIKYWDDERRHSVVCTRFKLDELKPGPLPARK